MSDRARRRNGRLATTPSCSDVHCVAIATTNTRPASSRRYGARAICAPGRGERARRSAGRAGPGRRARMRRLAISTIAAAERDQQRQHEQQVDRAADRFDEHPRQHAGGHRAERRARADQPEQPLRLPRVEQRVGEAPRLHRRDDAVAVHPDIEDVRAAAGTAWNRNTYQNSRTLRLKNDQRRRR